MNIVTMEDSEPRPFRDAILDLIPTLEGVSPEECKPIAFQYWDTQVRGHIRTRTYEDGWHCIRFALLGKDALVGPDRICRGNAGGHPLNLLCSVHDGMNLVHILYYALLQHKEFLNLLRMPLGEEDWGGRRIHENKVATLIRPHEGMFGIISSNLALGISNWANHYRRLCPTAH